MLTPFLEKLIFAGQAVYKSYVVGGSGVGTIPVQSNQAVVIIDFLWNPFCDVDLEEVIIEEAIANCIHYIRFKSQDQQSVFSFRDNPELIIDVEGVALGFKLPDPIQVNSYLLCRKTVQIDIWKFSPSGNIFTQSNPLAVANEPNVPNGYTNAVANPPVLGIVSGQGASIIPLGNSRDSVTSTPRLADEFIDDIGDLTELSLPVTNQSFPLVTVGYVLIKDFSEKSLP